ncbi:hypothetical protein HID58_031463 [Brassica napus]|uniref:(rape) hypothetical protein n=2 Tax=Brassica TaxID=3705 RepID=A0A816NGG6_BRANA|nr:hypothetical protein HID58_031463 [Brassica napus]CAF2034425.1 unnamed protein product [Brassica napus]
MKPESKKKRIPIKQGEEGDDFSFNLSSLKEVIEDCTNEKKKTSSTKNLLDMSSLSQALSLVKRKIIRKERLRHQRRKRRAVVKIVTKADPATDALIQLLDIAKIQHEEEVLKDLNLHNSNIEPTRACTEPQLCTLNQEMDILDLFN